MYFRASVLQRVTVFCLLLPSR